MEHMMMETSELEWLLIPETTLWGREDSDSFLCILICTCILTIFTSLTYLTACALQTVMIILDSSKSTHQLIKSN